MGVPGIGLCEACTHECTRAKRRCWATWAWRWKAKRQCIRTRHSMQSALCAARSNSARPRVEEARVHEGDVSAHGNLSSMQREMERMRESHACQQGHDASVQRRSTCLHMTYAHVHRDISVVHGQRRAQSADSGREFASRDRTAQRHITRAHGHCTSASRDGTSARWDVRDASAHAHAA